MHAWLTRNALVICTDLCTFYSILFNLRFYSDFWRSRYSIHARVGCLFLLDDCSWLTKKKCLSNQVASGSIVWFELWTESWIRLFCTLYNITSSVSIHAAPETNKIRFEIREKKNWLDQCVQWMAMRCQRSMNDNDSNVHHKSFRQHFSNSVAISIFYFSFSFSLYQ